MTHEMSLKARAKEAKNGLKLKPELKLLVKSGPESRRVLAAICYKGGHSAGKYSDITNISIGDVVYIMSVLKEEGYIEEVPGGFLAPQYSATPRGKAKLLYDAPELERTAISEIV